MPSPKPYRIKITKSELAGLFHGEIQGHMQKISILAQYQSKFAHFWLKIEADQISAIFQNFYKDIENLIRLEGTKVFN